MTKEPDMTLPLVFILNGPNLNMLGVREPHLYGTQTLADLDSFCANEAEKLGLAVDCRQSNHEGDLVDWIQESHGKADAILLNAAAYARTSMAIQSAVRAVSTPIIEIHITNIYTKEAYRPRSLLSYVAKGIICGFGFDTYRIGLQAVHHMTTTQD